MKRITFVTLFLLLCTLSAQGGIFGDRLFYGGNFGLTFSGSGSGNNYTQIQVAPLVGFRATSFLDVGVQVAYEYYSNSYTSANGWGGGLFARYIAPIPFLQRINSGIFAHAEYDYMHYNIKYKDSGIADTTADRSELPLGVGIYIPMGGRARMSVAALWDVIHLDEYRSAVPSVRIGIEF